MKFTVTLIVSMTLLVCESAVCNAQGVGINSSGNSPDPSSIIDASSTTKGALMPRMTAAQRDAISSPANGLIIFNIDCQNLNIYTTSGWQPVNNPYAGVPGSAGTITGSSTV